MSRLSDKAAATGDTIFHVPTPPSGLGMCSLHMMTHAPEVLMQLWLLQNLGVAAVSAPEMHRALFSPDTPMTTVEAMMPRLQRESNRVMFELLAPPRIRPQTDGAVPSLVVGGDADKFLPVRAFDEAAAFWLPSESARSVDVLKEPLKC